MAQRFSDWLPTGSPKTGLFSKLFGGGGKKGGGIETYQPPPYSGERPYSGLQVGYGEDELKSLAGAYLPELKRRAMGEGLVGFDPSHRATLRGEFLKDFGDYESDIYSKASQQASGQGLRGGVPLSIRGELTKDLGRARESGLAGIDIADLEARRADINAAFYQQPEEVTRGAGIQQNRANFDLAEYEATSPQPFMQQQQPSILPSLIQAGATLAGTYYGGPAGGAAAGALAGKVAPQANKSLGSSYFGQQDTNDIFANYRASMRRY